MMEVSSSSAVICGHRRTRLHDAVKRKDLKLIRNALDHSPSEFGVFDINGRSPLVVALLDDAWELVSVMLECKTVNVLAISHTDVVLDETGSTVYHKLMKQANFTYFDRAWLKVMCELVSSDPNFKVVDFKGNSPLHVAAEADRDVIDFIGTGGNINAQNCEGLTPLHLAIRRGNTAAVLTLLRHGADVRLTDELFNTPIHFVNFTNYDEFRPIFADVTVPSMKNVFGQVSPLLWLSMDGNVDFNYWDYLGNSALHLTAGFDQQQFLSDKFDSKYYANRNVFGQTPVHLVIMSLKADLSKLLSDSRVKLSLATADGRGRNIMHYMFLFRSMKDRYIDDVVNNHMAPFSSVTHEDVTVHFSKKMETEASIANSQLTSKVAALERLRRVEGCSSYDSLGRTPLHYAAMHVDNCKLCGNLGCWCICSLYLFGMDCLRVQDKFGRTPVHYAALRGNRPTVSVRRILSKAGFNVDDVYNSFHDIDGFTPQQISNNMVLQKHKRVRVAKFTSPLSSSKNMHHEYDPILCPWFAVRIDTWSVWQEELKRGLYSPTSRHLTAAVYDAVTSFMERLVNAIGREDARLCGRLLAVGSAFERTKLDWLNDFNFNVALLNFTKMCEVRQPVQCPPGFRVLKKLPDIDLSTEQYAAFADFFNDDHSLKTPAINFWFQRALVKVLSWQAFWDDEPLFELWLGNSDLRDFYRITPNKLCKMLKLTVCRPILGKHINFTISVKVTPVIHFPHWWPEDGVQVDDVIRSEGCNFVFDQPQREYQVPFSQNQHYVQISFARAESLSLLRRSAVVRAAYVVAERIWRSFDITSNIRVSSHVIKVAALCSTSGVSDEDNCVVVSKAALRTRVEKLFAKLYEFAVDDRAMSSFMPSLSIKLWNYEKFVRYSHTVLQQTSMDYKTLFDAQLQMEQCKLTEVYYRIRQSLLIAYALYSAVSCREPVSGVEWTYPQLSDIWPDRRTSAAIRAKEIELGMLQWVRHQSLAMSWVKRQQLPMTHQHNVTGAIKIYSHKVTSVPNKRNTSSCQ